LRTVPWAGRNPRTPSKSYPQARPADEAGDVELVDLERHRRVVGHGRLRRVHVGELAAHHAPGHLGGREVGDGERTDLVAVAQDRDAVGDRHDLVELVRHVEDRDAVGRQAPDQVEEHLGLAPGEDVGRLVHAQDADLARHRLGDLDHLRLRHRQVAYPPGDRDLGAQGGEQLGGGAAGGRAVDQAEAVRLAAEEDVLLDREVGHQVELLVDEDDPCRLGGVGVGELDRAPFQCDLARARAVVAGEQLHQRRLAGAVLAHQRVDLPGAHVDVDGVEDLDGSEGLAEADAVEDRFVRHRVPPFGR